MCARYWIVLPKDVQCVLNVDSLYEKECLRVVFLKNQCNKSGNLSGVAASELRFHYLMNYLSRHVEKDSPHGLIPLRQVGIRAF